MQQNGRGKYALPECSQESIKFTIREMLQFNAYCFERERVIESTRLLRLRRHRARTYFGCTI